MGEEAAAPRPVSALLHASRILLVHLRQVLPICSSFLIASSLPVPRMYSLPHWDACIARQGCSKIQAEANGTLVQIPYFLNASRTLAAPKDS
jgi:hypothetical protein